jgi:hypothetical protein
MKQIAIFWWGPDSIAPPFGIGDVNPDGSFVHVFDDRALDILMKELDTVTDFANYLTRRERFIRSRLMLATLPDHDIRQSALACFAHRRSASPSTELR